MHDPAGMIALCPTHHGAADGNVWSDAQLRAFKAHPFVDNELNVRWPWEPERLIIKCGRTLVLGTGSPLRLNGKPILFLRPRQIDSLGCRAVALDSQITDASLQPWLAVEDNSLTVDTRSLRDLEFTHQQRRFRVRHFDSTFLSISFMRRPLTSVDEWCRSFMPVDIAASAVKSIKEVGCVDRSDRVAVLTVEGSFRSAEAAITVRGHVMKGKLRIAGRAPEQIDDFGARVVDAERRAILRYAAGDEFLSLG